MTPQESYLADVARLQEFAAKCPHVDQDFILLIASMPREELQRRALVWRDYMGHFTTCLDGIKEIQGIGGGGIDGGRFGANIRTIVEALIKRINAK